MPKEIERKFLIDIKKLDLPDNGIVIRQGYLPTSSKTVVRVRIKGVKAFLTVKGENKGAVRSEYEYDIPLIEAEELLNDLCDKPFIDKTRYEINVADHIWEVDIFHGENSGLIVAEIELDDETEKFELPSWVTEEVTGDAKYYNSNLLNNPYNKWSKND